MVEYDSVSQIRDGREIEITRPENASPMEDPIVTQNRMPENLSPMSTPMTSLTWPCVDSPQSPTMEYDSVNRMRDGREIEMTRPESAPPMEEPIMTQKKMPENLTPMSTPMTSLTWPCVDSQRSPTVEYHNVNKIRDSCGIEITRPESAPPMIDSNVTLKNRPENFTPVSTPMTSPAWPCVDSPRLPTEKSGVVHRMKDFDYQKNVEDTQFRYDTEVSNEELEDAMRLKILRNRLGRPVNATDSDISLDKLRSEGWWRWNTDMEIEYQYETFNGLPVYYGGDRYDSDDSEDSTRTLWETWRMGSEIRAVQAVVTRPV